MSLSFFLHYLYSHLFYLGIKYRFRAGDEMFSLSRLGVGFHALLIYERIQLSTDDIVQDTIDGTFVTNDIKFGAGLSLFF